MPCESHIEFLKLCDQDDLQILSHLSVSQQVGSSILDDFISVLTSVVNPSSPDDKKKNKEFIPLHVPPPPIVTSFDINKFYENVLSATDFTKLLESQLKAASLEVARELNVDKIQEICWKCVGICSRCFTLTILNVKLKSCMLTAVR